MTIRKNFIFDESIAKHLEELAKLENKTQTQTIQELIEQKYKELEKKRKLEILNEVKNAFNGQLTNIDAKEALTQRALSRGK